MKVRISQRAVYYKTAEVEIEIDKDELENFKLNNGEYTTIQDYLIENEHLYAEKLDDALEQVEYEDGLGMESGDWTDKEDASESRFDVVGENFGGHL